jgi:hypothetical protein
MKKRPLMFVTKLMKGLVFPALLALAMAACSQPTGEGPATPQDEIPAAPGKASLAQGPGTITVSWEAVPGAAEYEVYYALAESPEEKTAYYLNPVSGTSAVIHGLENGQTYTVWVKAKNARGASGFSEDATAVVLSPLGFAEAALDAAVDAGGYDAERPLSLSVGEIELTQTNWTALCVLLGEKQIPVVLDLSDCLPDPVSEANAYGLRSDGAFDARVNTKAEGDAYAGQAYIVSLVLPYAATATSQIQNYGQPGGAFFGFTGLNTVRGANVITVGALTFFEHSSLQVVDFPKLESIGTSAFEECAKLESVTLPGTLTSIGSAAFWGIKTLGPSLDLSGTALSVIMDSAFGDCIGIEEVILPEGLEEIENSAFYNCMALTGALALPASLKGIGSYAFGGTNITSFTGGDGDHIRIFYDGKILVATISADENEAVVTVLPGSPAVIDLSETAIVRIFNTSGFAGNTTITSVTLPESCTTFIAETFKGCTALKSVTAPGLTSLGQSAFDGCTSLEEYTLPSGYTPTNGNINNMGNMFRGCTALQSLTWPDAPVPTTNMTEPPAYTIPRNEGLVIYVPAERVDAYRTKWSSYWGQNNRIQAIPAS